MIIRLFLVLLCFLSFCATSRVRLDPPIGLRVIDSNGMLSPRLMVLIRDHLYQAGYPVIYPDQSPELSQLESMQTGDSFTTPLSQDQIICVVREEHVKDCRTIKLNLTVWLLSHQRQTVLLRKDITVTGTSTHPHPGIAIHEARTQADQQIRQILHQIIQPLKSQEIAP